MALRREMDDRARVMLFEQLPDKTAIADIAVNKFIPPIRRDALQIVQVPGVRQLVQIDDRAD